MSIMWEPSSEQKEASEITRYLHWLKEKYNLSLERYDDFYNWSCQESVSFWKSLIEYYQVSFTGDLNTEESELKFLDYFWFPNTRLNFCENLLKNGRDQDIALHFFHESGIENKITYSELKEQTSKLYGYLKDYISEGDVVAAYMPNVSETVVGMLATTALGGVFTSTSSDFGVGGVVDRFGQSRPKVLIAASRYTYNGREFNQMEKISQIVEAVDSIEKVIFVDFLENREVVSNLGTSYSIIMKNQTQEIEFCPRKFSDPLYIMYSSGTTGTPKCIVHSVGGTLIQHLKELGLHTNLTQDKGIFYFTTCGWMMWNWLVSSLAFGSRVGLYEGSPASPSLNDFMAKIDQAGFEIWGTSPKFLRALELSGYNKEYSFEKLEVILSTGAPLLPEQYDFVYEKIKSEVQLSSISGGTDIIGCFMLGNPVKPVYRGELQTRGLGLSVESLDLDGNPVRDTEGELVCLKSFPSQPIYFLNDESGERYRSAYFETFGDRIWHHGDFVTIKSHGGVVVHGRSDATLNPGGVRIGTAEIYRQIEQLDFVDDSLCVGKNEDGDVSVTLFIKPKNENFVLSDEIIKDIKTNIKSKTTPRHVPKYIKLVDGIPYTRSGKKMELAVTRLINGRALNNIEAVSNPECLEQYEKAFG